MVEVKVKDTQSCLTHCDPMKHCDPMDFTVHEILQARILEWVTFPFSRGSSQPKDRTQVSCIAGGSMTKNTMRKYKGQRKSEPGVGKVGERKEG